MTVAGESDKCVCMHDKCFFIYLENAFIQSDMHMVHIETAAEIKVQYCIVLTLFQWLVKEHDSKQITLH